MATLYSKCFTPREPFLTNIVYYKDHFIDFSEDGFIQRPRYMDTYMPHNFHKALGQLLVLFDQLEIETGRGLHIPRAERFR